MKKFPLAVIVVLVFVLGVVNASALYWHLYFYIWWLDIPMHLLGGFWVALSALVFYYDTRWKYKKDRTSAFAFRYAFLVTLAVGLGWEAFELLADKLSGTINVNIGDTLSDIMNDMIGAACATFFFLRKGYNKTHGT